MREALGTGWLVPVVGLVLTLIVVPALRWVVNRWRNSCANEKALRDLAEKEARELKNKYEECAGRYSEERIARLHLEWQVEMYRQGFDPTRKSAP